MEENEPVEERAEEVAEETSEVEEFDEATPHYANEFSDVVARLETLQSTLERVESLCASFVENGATIQEDAIEDVNDVEIYTSDLDDLNFNPED